MGWMLGDYVGRLLTERDWTAYKLSQKIGVSHSYVSSILHGGTAKDKNPPKISVDILIALAKAFQIPETHLLLAYKGIDPDKVTEVTEDTLDLPHEVILSALRAGCEWEDLQLAERKRVLEGVRKMTRRFIDIAVERELEHLG